MSVVNNLDLNIINNEITNINELVTILNQSELNEEMIEHIKTLSNRLASMDIANKAELSELLSSKIMEYEANQQENISNQSSLNMLKSINEDFQKLNIISTKREDNDSNRYIDYLTYTNERGEVEMLSCESNATINDFIQTHINELPTMSASDVFHYFKEYVHREVEFKTPEEMKNDPDARKKAIVNDPEIEMQELNDVENYKNTYGIQEQIMVSIDNNGERIYRVGDGIIKFRTTENKREMQVLKKPSLTKIASFDEMLAEIDGSPEVEQAAEVEKTDVTTKDDNEARSDSYDSLETIDEEYFNSVNIDEIVAKRDVYDIELSYEEEHRLNLCVKFLLEHMKTNIESNKPSDGFVELATSYMGSARGDKASIIDTYMEIQDGKAKEDELNDIEKEFASKFIDYKEQMKSLGLDKNLDKKRELNNPFGPISGVTSIVVLLELITLAMFIMMFLRLDI